MSERQIYDVVLWGFLASGAVIFVSLLFITAPYGRHVRSNWGPTLPARFGWVLMEIPSPALMILFFALGDRHTNGPAIALLCLWLLHYGNRTFVFPFRLSPGSKPMPLAIAAFGFLFNLFNGYLNGRYLFSFGPPLPEDWLLGPQFIGGAAVFFTGFAINQHSDAVLRRLRKPGETGYRIPHGGLYRWVSSPNYLGELIEWLGFALASASPAAWVFFAWTACNLVPRAIAHHRWYRKTFPDYPPERRAILPGLL
jgi:protein-S-isoprenylcysteine O-methyltransferase Ste14